MDAHARVMCRFSILKSSEKYFQKFESFHDFQKYILIIFIII